LDLIITDHHQPAGDLPPALAIINPKQEGDAYPDKDLAGVGVAFKIAQALFAGEGRKANDQNPLPPAGHPMPDFLDSLLDLVALGTVADLAPLTGENRSLVSKGLARMRQPQRQGLFALANVAGVTLAKVTATNIGFGLGPRLNASGRLESALASYQLLMESRVFEAGQLAIQLDQQNRNRQLLTRDIQEKANLLAFAVEQSPFILVAVDRDFNPGVVGLAAALWQKLIIARPSSVIAMMRTPVVPADRSRSSISPRLWMNVSIYWCDMAGTLLLQDSRSETITFKN
jgi:single-stranded-DNA-specific exonuclease